MEEKPNLHSAGNVEGGPKRKEATLQAPAAGQPAGGFSAPEKESTPALAAQIGAPRENVSLRQQLLWSKRFWLGLVLLAFIFYGTTLVPVAKIPFLRTLVEAMGYTEAETHQISFFKALLTWNEHSKAQKAQAADDLQARTSTANAVSGALESARLNNQSGLLNLREVSRALKEQGKEGEVLTRITTVDANASKEAQLVQMSGRERQVTTQADSRGSALAPQIGEQDISAEVFFGGEEGQIQRDPNNGFDSTKMLAGANVPGMIDSTPSDWKLDAAESIWQRHHNIVFNNKLFKVTDIGRTQGTEISTIADIKPRADVVYSWMTSRAARRTRNIPLKQTLSKAGFMGADLSRPMLVTAVDGTGTLPIDAKRMKMDFNVAQDRMKLAAECEEAMEGKDDKIFENMRKAKQEQEKLAGYLATCATVLNDGANQFTNGLNTIQEYCNKSKDTYNSFKGKCRMEIITGTCNNEQLNAFAASAKKDCEQRLEECASSFSQDLAAQEACKQAVMSRSPSIGTDDVEKAIDSVMNYQYDPENPEKVSYFSQVDWAGTLRNRRFAEEL